MGEKGCTSIRFALKEEIATDIVPSAIKRLRANGWFSVIMLSLAKAAVTEPLVALGVARGKNKKDVRLAVRLQRRSLEQADAMLDAIRKRARNEVDVRFVGRIARQLLPWHRSRVRPLVPGASVGHFRITAGTIGALATEKRSGRVVILSNNHVLANENNAKVGDAILQPGAYDGGRRPADMVAKLTKWVRRKPKSADLVDAAIAAVMKKIGVDPLNYHEIGTLTGARADPLLPGDAVAKAGRTTGVTRGRVTAIEVDNVVVEYDIGLLTFDNQIEIESTETGPFSAGGDSGSLILDVDNRGCALLFAGSETGGASGRGLTYANQIDLVLKKLAIELPTP